MTTDREDRPRDEAEEQAAPAGEQPQAPDAGPAARHPRKWLKAVVLLIVLVAIVAVGVTVYPLLSRPDPRRLVEEMLAAYKGAKTYTAECTYQIEMKMGGMQQTVELPMKLAYQAPNLLLMEQGEGMTQSKTVCDGKHLYVEMGMFDRVGKLPAPKDLEDTDHQWAMDGLVGRQMRLLDFRSLLSGKIDLKDVESIKAGLDRDVEWLAEAEAPPGTSAVTVKLADAPPMTLWVDRRSRLLRQIACTISGEDMQKMSGAVADERTADLLSYLQDIEMKMIITYDKQSVGEPVAKDAFAYKPPEGKEVVEAESMQKLSEAMMGGEFPDFEMPEGMPESKDLTGEAPPDFTAQDLDGKPVEFSSFKGKPLILDFWSTWCAPCLRELPILDELYGKLKGEGLQVVAISTDMSLDAVKSYLKKSPFSFTVLWLAPEASGEVSDDYGITGIPRTLYIGDDWLVKADTTGLHPKKDMLEHIKALGVDTSAAE